MKSLKYQLATALLHLIMPDRAINRDNEGKSQLFKFEFAAEQVAAVVRRQIRKSLACGRSQCMNDQRGRTFLKLQELEKILNIEAAGE